MSIDKTASGKWRVRVDIGRDRLGKRKRKTGVFATKREAKAAEHLWSELARKNVIARDSMGFSEFVEEVYLPQVELRLRFNTLKAYKRDIKLRLIPAFGNMPLEKINHERIQAMLNNCSSYKVATNARDMLRQILNVAISKSYITTNPATDAYIFPVRTVYPEDHNGDWLTSFEEHDRFIEKIDNELFLTVALLGLSLGLRKGEIFGLDWQNIDFNKRLVHVQKTYVKEDGGHKLMVPKTKKSNRFVPLRKKAAQVLLGILSQREDQMGAVCVNYQGQRANPNRTANRWVEYLQKNDLPYVTILNMRHSFATACLMAGMEISKVSRYLGHASISTTVNRYVRYKDEEMVSDFDQFVD